MIIFKPSLGLVTQLNGQPYVLLQGHVGALTKNAGGTALTVGMAAFHDELRAAFDGSKTIRECAAGIKQVVAKWVWNGEAPKVPIHPAVTCHQGGSVAEDSNARAKAAANYAAIQAMLDSIISNGV